MFGKHADPFDFVLERFLPFLAAHETFDAARAFTIFKIDVLLHLGFVFGGEDARLFHEDFAVVAVGIAPLEVLVGGLFHVHFYVLEGVLFDIANTKVGMFLDFSSLGDGFAGEKFDQG